VGPQQVDLELTDLVTGDADIAELANSGGDRVRDFVACNQCFHHSTGANDSFASIRRKKDSAALDSNFADIFQSEIVTVDVKSFQLRLLVL
jgi:hypothetical protein